MNILQVKNLKKHYIDKKWWLPGSKPIVTQAVNRVSFEINKGEIVGLLGPNGAGKTTITHMLLGTLTPTAGDIYYFGKKFSSKSKEVLDQVNFSSAYIRLPWLMTVWENLDVYARLYCVKNKKQRIERLLKEFEVFDLKKRKINQLSSGQITRVLLAKAFINYPKILILDEPTASLDPDIAQKVRKFLIKQQKEYKVAMLFTSHNMHEVQEICDRIIFLDKGKIIAHDTPLGLVKKLKKTKIRMQIDKNKELLEKYLKEKKFKYLWKNNQVIFSIDEQAIPKVLYKISDQGIRYSDIEILRPNLEDFFLSITTKKNSKKRKTKNKKKKNEF